MDDIIEKLSLLDYENAFCKGWKHKRISRVYFAHPPQDEDEVNRIHMLYDIIYWLISLNKDQVSPSIPKTPNPKYSFFFSFPFPLLPIFLIYLSPSQSKKQGVFINFKDFKGKLDDALSKLISDLRKFGLPNVKNLKVENIR